ncbi:MAG: hypothetical protein JSV33_13660 [bacterium]|nr:MAG: hypothetical protein JSV33_13660 [bacterium]
MLKTVEMRLSELAVVVELHYTCTLTPPDVGKPVSQEVLDMVKIGSLGETLFITTLCFEAKSLAFKKSANCKRNNADGINGSHNLHVHDKALTIPGYEVYF